MDWLLTKTIEAGREAGVISERSVGVVIVDTTVMESRASCWQAGAMMLTEFGKRWRCGTCSPKFASREIALRCPAGQGMYKTRKMRVGVDHSLYLMLRNLVERCFNKLKNARRVATRDKTAETFLGFIDNTSTGLWLCLLPT